MTPCSRAATAVNPGLALAVSLPLAAKYIPADYGAKGKNRLKAIGNLYCTNIQNYTYIQ